MCSNQRKPHETPHEEEVNASLETLDKDNEMERGLSNRHVQFIAIGGAIGTGLSSARQSIICRRHHFVYILVAASCSS